MINREEAALCKRRGHQPTAARLSKDWQRCKYCGIWLREVTTIEEREDTPPKNQRDAFADMVWDLHKKAEESSRELNREEGNGTEK